MKGLGKAMIDKLFSLKAKNDPIVQNSIRVKLILKGIPVDSLTASSVEDESVLNNIREVAKTFGVIV